MNEHVRPPELFPIDISGAPTVVLAGKEWPIPALALKQQRIVIPNLRKVIPLMRRIDDFNKKLKDNPDRDSMSEFDLIEAVACSDEEYDAMIAIIHAGLSRAHPGIARNEIENMPISLRELVTAVPAIVAQVDPASSGAAKQGE